MGENAARQQPGQLLLVVAVGLQLHGGRAARSSEDQRSVAPSVQRTNHRDRKSVV